MEEGPIESKKKKKCEAKSPKYRIIKGGQTKLSHTSDITSRRRETAKALNENIDY